MSSFAKAFLPVVFVGFLVSTSLAADWPQWRFDSSRSGSTEAGLPNKLFLQWTLELPKTTSAWLVDARMQFDTCYEPVVMGKKIYIGSPNDGSIAAYDTETGELKWKFYTEGPVRFAPVAFNGKIYAASDDGRLYCLDGETGSINWTFRAAPKDRADLKHLGNARLISYWPARGGPVLFNGRIYVASGLWTTMGAFVYALNPESGEVVWSNEKLNYIANVRIDHNELFDTGLSPQGYLVVESGRLLVPNGRSMPAGLDPNTGRLLFYLQGYRNGEWRVIARDKLAFVGLSGVVDLESGREMGALRFNPEKDKYQKLSGYSKMFIGEVTNFQYKFISGCDAWSVFGDGVLYGSDKGVFYAYDLKHPKLSAYDAQNVGQTWRACKWELPELWKLQAGSGPSRALMRAGFRLYGHSGQNLIAVDPPRAGGQPKAAWEEKLPGTPGSLLAADGKLFVVTLEGQVLCYGGKAGAAKTRPLVEKPLSKISDKWSERAGAILKASQVSEGYCLVLGLESGRLVEELLGQPKLKVIGVDGDRGRIDALRDRFASAGVYGKRVELFAGNPADFSFPPYIANLVVSETMAADAFCAKVPAEKVFSALRPYGGVVCLESAGDKFEAFKSWASAGKLENAEATQAEGFALLRRSGALPGSADWTHESGDEARSYLSKDKAAKPPFGILWYGDPTEPGCHENHSYGTGVRPAVAGGRIVARGQGFIYALDAYTGRFLWKHEVERFFRFCSRKDGVYLAMGNACLVLDPATGAVRKRFSFNDPGNREAKLFVADILVSDEVIVVGAAYNKTGNIAQGLWDSSMLVGLDRATGKQLWCVNAASRFNAFSISMGEGLVYCADSLSVKETGELQRRGNPPKTLDVGFMALDAKTGQVKWKKKESGPFKTYSDGSWTGQRSFDDWTAYSKECKVLLAGKNGNNFAFDPQTGNQLWNSAEEIAQPVILRDMQLYSQKGSIIDIRTGQKSGSTGTDKWGCNYAVGSECMILGRATTVSYLDLESGKMFYVRSARSGCSSSVIPADGLICVPNYAWGCVCNYPIQTAFCMAPMPYVKDWAGSVPLKQAFAEK